MSIIYNLSLKFYQKNCGLWEVQIMKYIALHHLIFHHFNFLLICFALRNRIDSSFIIFFSIGTLCISNILHCIEEILFAFEQPFIFSQFLPQ